MRPLSLIVATGAVAIVLVAVVFGPGLMSQAPINGPAASVAPTEPAAVASPAAIASLPTMTYRSERYGFTLTLPLAWSAAAARGDWPVGQLLSPGVTTLDTFTDPRGAEFGVMSIASQQIPAGMSFDQWLTQFSNAQIEAGGPACGGTKAAFEPTTFAGLPALTQRTDCGGAGQKAALIRHIVFQHGDRAWLITGDDRVVQTYSPSFELPTQ
jgi:hypothetical protein